MKRTNILLILAIGLAVSLASVPAVFAHVAPNHFVTPPVISNVAVTPNVTNNHAGSITISATITTVDNNLWHPYFEVHAPGDAGVIYGWMDSTISSGVFNYSVDLQVSANFKSPVTSFADFYNLHGGGVYQVVVGVSDFQGGGHGFAATPVSLSIHTIPPEISNVAVSPSVTNNHAGSITISETITTGDSGLWHPVFEVHAPGNAGVIYGWAPAISSGVFNYSVDLQVSANFMSPVKSFADFYAIHGGGVYRIVLGVTDHIPGGYAYYAPSIFLTIDTIGPQVTITHPSDGTTTPSAVVTVSAVVSDNSGEVASVKAALNEVELTYDATEGEYSGLVLQPMQGFDITVTAKDAAGNEGSDTVSIIKVHDMGKRSKP